MTHATVFALQMLSTFISLAMLILAIYKRQAPHSLYFAYVVLAIFLFNFGYLIEISTTTMEMSIFGKQAKYLGVPFIAPSVLLFVLEYYGEKKLNRQKWLLLFFIPMVQCVLAITFPWNGLYYTGIQYVADAAIPHYEMQGSFLYYACFMYTYILLLCAIALAIYYHRKGDAIHKKQSAIIIIATTIPAIGNAFNVLGARLLSFDITSLLLSGTCVLLGYSFLRLGLFQIAPIAREKIVETMQDAFVLVDPHGRYIDANASAKKLFPQMATASIGAPVASIEGIPWIDMNAAAEDCSFCLQDEAGDTLYYSISKTIVRHQNKPICNCIMIYDITESKKLLNEVSRLAERDALTGLLNRGAFFKKGESAFREIASQKGDMAVLMMDLDHFKKLNDTFGHLAGDKVLATVAQTLSPAFRESDFFARYGGEEFCAFLPGTKEDDALQIAKQLCAMVESIGWGRELENLRVTISIGVAVYNSAHHYTLDALIHSADTALYAAKNAGRNNVRLFCATQDN